MSLLRHATSVTTRGSQTTALAVLVHGVHDPVDRRVVADGGVVGVHQNHLVVLVGRVLVHPVAVQHAQVGAHAAHTALGNHAQIASVLQLVDTLVLGLAVHNTLGVGSLASSTADRHAVHHVALLRLHAQLARLIGASGMGHTAHLGELTVLPGANTQQIAHRVALLLSPQFFKILVGTHVVGMRFCDKSKRHGGM